MSALLTTADAAAKLGISDATFRRLAKKYSIRPASIEEYWARRKRITRFHYVLAVLAPMLEDARKSAARSAKLQCTKDDVTRRTNLAQFFGAIGTIPQWTLERLGSAFAAIGRTDALAALGPNMSHALDCMHALNRAAKHAISPLSIYALKDRFCDALLRSGKATLYMFDHRSDFGWHECDECGRSWVGDDWCHGCDAPGDGARYPKRWYVVDAGNGGWRFHRPTVDDDLAVTAIPCEPHDPTQGRKPIPDVYGPTGAKLTMAEQVATVEAAILALSQGEPAIAAE